MYDIEALRPFESGSGFEGRWEPVYDIPQLETEQAELQMARTEARSLRKFYVEIRITKSLPGGERKVVK